MVVLMLLWPINGILEVFFYSSTNIKRLFLFLLVLAVLLNVSSRVYCNNYKFNYNKNTKQGFLEPKPTS